MKLMLIAYNIISIKKKSLLIQIDTETNMCATFRNILTSINRVRMM